ncbi:MAG: flagellar basal body P-ring formation chaperone FlgA [Phycisphaeraceae bacterium]
MANAASVTLSDQAGVAGPQVTLAQVAMLEGDEATALSDIVVGVFAKDAGALKVTLADVERVLRERQINRVTMTLRGFATCTVARLREDPAKSRAAEPAEALSNPYQPVDLASALTLGERVVAMIEALAGVGRDELKITFGPGDQAVRDTPVGDLSVEIEPGAKAAPGRVPFTIRLYQGQALATTHRVTADVSRRWTAMVLKRTIARGDVIAAGDIEARLVYVQSAGRPATELEQVVGNVAKGVLRSGAVVMLDDLHPPLMVHRHDTLTIRAFAGNMVVAVAARALEDGAKDQVIQVRNEQSRQTLAVRVTGPREAVMVDQAKGTAQGDKP